MKENFNEYAEVLEFLNFIPKNEYDLIPLNIIQMLNSKSNNSNVELRTDEYGNVILTRKAQNIVVKLYKDYLSTSNEKNKIINKLKENYNKKFYKKEEKVNTSIIKNDVVNENNSKVIEETLTIEEDKKLLIKKENIFLKIINKIKNFFNKKQM